MATTRLRAIITWKHGNYDRAQIFGIIDLSILIAYKIPEPVFDPSFTTAGSCFVYTATETLEINSYVKLAFI